MTRLLFANHASAIAGAELVLLDVVRSWPGASAFLFEHGPLEAALASRGVNVTVARRGRTVAAARRDSSAVSVLPLAARFAAIAWDLAAAARRHDVVYANSQKAFVLAAAATALARKPLIWHLHDIIDPSHFGGAQRRLQVTLANRRARRVIVPSRAAADAFVAAGGRGDLLDLVPNGPGVAIGPRSRAEVRRELDLPTGPLLGVFSRLAAWKGQHVLIRALADVPAAHCVVVGDALFGERAYADGLRAMVAELGLGDRVHFLGHRADVPRLMQAVDAVVHPSVASEPFGRTLVEAMLVGTPVIASDAGACPDILDDGRAGTLVPPGNPAALARACAAVLARPDGLDEQLAHARRRAESRYGVAAMQASLATIVAAVARGERG